MATVFDLEFESCEVVQQPLYGALVQDGPRTFTYTANEDSYQAVDVFTVRLLDDDDTPVVGGEVIRLRIELGTGITSILPADDPAFHGMAGHLSFYAVAGEVTELPVLGGVAGHPMTQVSIYQEPTVGTVEVDPASRYVLFTAPEGYSTSRSGEPITFLWSAGDATHERLVTRRCAVSVYSTGGGGTPAPVDPPPTPEVGDGWYVETFFYNAAGDVLYLHVMLKGYPSQPQDEVIFRFLDADEAQVGADEVITLNNYTPEINGDRRISAMIPAALRGTESTVEIRYRRGAAVTAPLTYVIQVGEY